jgi:hypothetical protein
LWSETIAQINEEFEQQLRELKAQLKDIK